MGTDIILTCLGKLDWERYSKCSWTHGHANYTTLIHTIGTPLDTHPQSMVLSPAMTDYKIVVLGGSNVGKCALTMKFMTGDYVEYFDPTIEDSYRRQIALNTNDYDNGGATGTDMVSLDVMDTSCFDQFKGGLDQFIRSADICLLVFSIDCQESFEEVKDMRKRILRDKDDCDITCPVIVVGNKCDLRMHPGFDETKGVDMKNVLAWCQQHQVPYIETSAKNGKNVNFLFRQSVYEWNVQRQLMTKESSQSHSAEIVYSEDEV